MTLAPPRDHVYFTSLPPPIVARDGEGNYIVTRVGGDALVAVFGADGRFMSSHGTIGEGPGEFATVPTAMAIGADDVLHVIDPLALHTLAPRGIIHQDADGLLWITIGREASPFSPVTDDRPAGVEGPPVDPFVDLNHVMDITIEVLDPVAGELVARREFDEVVTFVSTPGDDVFVYSLHPDSLGDLDCVIRRLTLRRD